MPDLVLDSVRAKLARAAEHRDSLKREIQAWLDSGPYSFSVEPDADRKDWTIKLTARTRPDTQRLALILGDAIHNLRCALDHLLYAVVERYAPGAGIGQRVFPIHDSVNQFWGKPGKPETGFRHRGECFGFPAEVWAAIEAEQPYKRGDGKTMPLLAILNYLNVTDKHHALPVLLTLNEQSGQANASSYGLSISATGRYVAFESFATNFVPGDSNNAEDVFLRDRQNDTTERVSVASNGAQSNSYGHSYWPSISGDGRFVAFESQATNLVPGDTNNARDVFVRDRQSGTTERVSVDSGGMQANGDSYEPSISANGRYVAFFSDAANLAPGDTNGALDVFVHDRQSGTTICVSVDPSGLPGNGSSYTTSISADGRYVMFLSDASNLVPGDTNGVTDAFLRDRQSGATERVTVGLSGQHGWYTSNCAPSISADGRYVAFDWSTCDMCGRDLFVRDRQTGTNELVSVNSMGRSGNDESDSPSISADGRYVAFGSYATNLVPDDTGWFYDAFVRDRLSHTTERVSVASDGTQGNQDSSAALISADGRYVAFCSAATNLVPDDTNGSADDFVRERAHRELVSLCDPGVSLGPLIAPPSDARGTLTSRSSRASSGLRSRPS